MKKNDKTVLERRKEIIGILKYFPLNEKKWILKRFWDHIEKASSFEDETKINRKLPPKLINDQKGQIMYMAFNLLLMGLNRENQTNNINQVINQLP